MALEVAGHLVTLMMPRHLSAEAQASIAASSAFLPTVPSAFAAHVAAGACPAISTAAAASANCIYIGAVFGNRLATEHEQGKT